MAKKGLGLINKTLERCRSIGTTTKRPKGCMTVYVGAHKERFVIRTECLNHPLFRELLEEAETEFGYACEGPIELPCEVEQFNRVMYEVDEDVMDGARPPQLCSLPASPARGYQMLSPMPSSRVVIMARRMSVG